MVVELRDAAVADPAVLGPERPHHAACVAQTEDVGVALALPLVVVRDLLDGSMKKNLGLFCFLLLDMVTVWYSSH